MIAFISAASLKPNKLFLCSLSHYFKEDLPSLEPSWKKFIGKNRVNDFKTISANSLAKKLTMPTVIFCGEAESKKYPQLEVRCSKTNKAIKNSKLVMVKDAPHQISHPEYIKAIKKEFT